MTRMYFEPATVIPLIWALDDGFGFGAHSRPIDRLSFDRSAQHSLTIEGAGLGGLVCVTGENLEACKEAGLSGVGQLELAIHDDMNTAQLYAEDLRRDPYFTVTLHSLENGYALTAASDPLNDFSISLADQRVSASALDIQDDKLLVTALETRAALDTSTREARLAESSAYARRRHALRPGTASDLMQRERPRPPAIGIHAQAVRYVPSGPQPNLQHSQYMANHEDFASCIGCGSPDLRVTVHTLRKPPVALSGPMCPRSATLGN